MKTIVRNSSSRACFLARRAIPRVVATPVSSVFSSLGQRRFSSSPRLPVEEENSQPEEKYDKPAIPQLLNPADYPLSPVPTSVDSIIDPRLYGKRFVDFSLSLPPAEVAEAEKIFHSLQEKYHVDVLFMAFKEIPSCPDYSSLNAFASQLSFSLPLQPSRGVLILSVQYPQPLHILHLGSSFDGQFLRDFNFLFRPSESGDLSEERQKGPSLPVRFFAKRRAKTKDAVDEELKWDDETINVMLNSLDRGALVEFSRLLEFRLSENAATLRAVAEIQKRNQLEAGLSRKVRLGNFVVPKIQKYLYFSMGLCLASTTLMWWAVDRGLLKHFQPKGEKEKNKTNKKQPPQTPSINYSSDSANSQGFGGLPVVQPR